jgi:hypothetical protein
LLSLKGGFGEIARPGGNARVFNDDHNDKMSDEHDST